jgi:hypothetical protein
MHTHFDVTNEHQIAKIGPGWYMFDSLFKEINFHFMIRVIDNSEAAFKICRFYQIRNGVNTLEDTTDLCLSSSSEPENP